ncbi:hypothetical protein GCM10027021_03080 [Dyella kyungheensis]
MAEHPAPAETPTHAAPAAFTLIVAETPAAPASAAHADGFAGPGVAAFVAVVMVVTVVAIEQMTKSHD